MKLMLPLFLLCSATAFSQEYQTEIDIPYTVATNDYMKQQCLLDIQYPVGTNGFPTVVWFHGGGLTSGDKHFPEGLLGQGMAVVSVKYRLYPNVKSPVYVEDAAASVAWIFRNIEQFGGDPDLIFLTGHSAGGYLASMVGMDTSYLAKYDIDANRIAGLIPLSGHTITHFTVRAERGIDGKQPIVDAMAPLYHVRADAPPVLLITGDRERELLGRYEENAYMMRMMRVAGHSDTHIMELGGYGHGIVKPAVPLIINEVRRLTDLSTEDQR